MKRFLIDFLKRVLGYLILIVGGTSIFMILCLVVGYLPYSDRPGPGWYGSANIFSIEGATYILEWATLLSIYAFFVGVILFVIIRFIEWLKIPRILVAVIGAILSGFMSGYIVLGIGWYIAIAASPVYCSILLGIIFGALILPGRIAIRKARA